MVLRENNLAKAFLVLNNALGHPMGMNHGCFNVQLLFLPPNTTYILQSYGPVWKSDLQSLLYSYYKTNASMSSMRPLGKTDSICKFWKSQQ